MVFSPPGVRLSLLSFKTHFKSLWEHPRLQSAKHVLSLLSNSLGSTLYYFHNPWGPGWVKAGAPSWDQHGKWERNWLVQQNSILRSQGPFFTEHLMHTIICCFLNLMKCFLLMLFWESFEWLFIEAELWGKKSRRGRYWTRRVDGEPSVSEVFIGNKV